VEEISCIISLKIIYMPPISDLFVVDLISHSSGFSIGGYQGGNKFITCCVWECYDTDEKKPSMIVEK
jgi:hypothetical protein